MKTTIFTICSLVFAAFVSCGAKGEQSTSLDTSAHVSAAQVLVAEETTADDEIKEMGLLKAVEDGGYPFATLTIEFPERKFTEYFSINFEEARGANLATIQNWIGKYVSFGYTSELTNALLDLHMEEKSLVSEEKITLGPDVKKITGILSGANEETPGDLPREVTITADNDTSLRFSFFVTKEMVEANGKEVVGFYEERTQNSIKRIKLSSK
jgi:hypothetical protein